MKKCKCCELKTSLTFSSFDGDERIPMCVSCREEYINMEFERIEAESVDTRTPYQKKTDYDKYVTRIKSLN